MQVQAQACKVKVCPFVCGIIGIDRPDSKG